MMKRVLITDYVHPDLIQGLNQMGYDVLYNKDFSPENLEEVLPELHGIVINTKSIMPRERIEIAQKLEFIARLGSGLDIIDLSAARERGIHVINTPEGNCDSVAEHVVGMLLLLANNLNIADQEVKQGIWLREENRGFELSGKKLGIVGMGHTGRSLAKKLSCWALDICYYDPYVLNLPNEFNYLKRLGWKELVTECDIISFHVQLTEETHHMANSDFFKACKRGMVLVNSSRGAVVDTRSLLNNLENGKLGGACLDVFENEKPFSYSDDERSMYERLFDMRNVIVSPHIAGWTDASLKRIADVMLSKLKRVL